MVTRGPAGKDLCTRRGGIGQCFLEPHPAVGQPAVTRLNLSPWRGGPFGCGSLGKDAVVAEKGELSEARRGSHADQLVVLIVSLHCHCRGCEGKVKKHLSRVQGVTSFNIDFASKVCDWRHHRSLTSSGLPLKGQKCSVLETTTSIITLKANPEN
ncbi:hypothetical protein F2Q69_00000988 [Brassica cretica]|uniref:HMA domain-containing protein n=1 Tax=Brassica cretica TaxID=69181 RepID=A0A8S9PBJ9_BRACR|nr:hypothetical protein F2Q69_00000988 [Brassica cretica]